MNQDQKKHVQTLLRMFQFYGCKSNTLLTQERLSSILNQQSNAASNRNISQQIIEQIWGQAETLSKGESTVVTIAKIIAQAISILQDRITKSNDSKIGIPHLKQELKAKQKELNVFENSAEGIHQEQTDKINTYLKNINLIQVKLRQLQEAKAGFQKDYSELQCCLKVREQQSRLEETIIVTNEYSLLSSASQNSSSYLKTIYTTTVFAVVLQLFIVAVRPSFLALLLQVLILFWLFYGYLHAYFVKFLLAGVAVSCFLDFSYVCLYSIGKISTKLTDSQTYISVLGMILLVIDTAIRIYLMILLCRYRQPPNRLQFFQTFYRKIYLEVRSGKEISI